MTCALYGADATSPNGQPKHSQDSDTWFVIGKKLCGKPEKNINWPKL
jgi:hypothetical protein